MPTVRHIGDPGKRSRQQHVEEAETLLVTTETAIRVLQIPCGRKVREEEERAVIGRPVNMTAKVPRPAALTLVVNPAVGFRCHLPATRACYIRHLHWILAADIVSEFDQQHKGLLAVLAAVFFICLVYTVATGSRTGRKSTWTTAPKRSYDTLITEERKFTSETPQEGADNLIQHHIQWKSYDSTVYKTTLSILRSEVDAAEQSHENLKFRPETTLAPVYNDLAQLDDAKLQRTYAAFDSIRSAAQLDERAFAKMVVSCIQSIPYFLVVDKSCNPREYQNSFINQFLNQCESECCVGYAKYGVRSPAELIGDLKGDCDSRSLLLYCILKKFNYDVALLTSVYYQHATIAVHFNSTNDKTDGVAMPIKNKYYMLWETTQAGMKPGDIPVAYQDLDNWSVDLLHAKKLNMNPRSSFKCYFPLDC